MEIDDSHQSYIAGGYMDFLEDKGGGLTFKEVNQPPWIGRFQPLGRDIAVFSFSRSAFWMRLTMINKTSTAQDLILHQYTSWIDSFDIYITGVDGKTETRKSGERYPFGQREIEHNHLLFRLALAPGESIRITMRAQSQDPLQLPITIWKEAAFDGYNSRLNMYFGVVFGSLFVVFLYNMMLYASLRDIVYLHYILYIFSLIFMIFIYTGYAYQYLWPDNPALQSQLVFPSGYLAMFLAIFIAKSFLDTARNMPRIHMAITIFQAMCLALPLYGFIADDYLFTSLTCSVAALIFPILMGFAGVVAYLAQVRAARFFILAWASSLIGQMVSMGTLFGLFPPDEIYRRMMEVGFMADAVFLSFALADRVRILRQEKELAETVAINALEASKDELERKVAQRTAELSSEKERAEAATRLKDKFVAL
ncbi:MAG: hypothetical protein OEV92_09140, partial [Nitrospinota bacterium]|nr:hypothetical protein [Nitrospinota bacterium]